MSLQMAPRGEHEEKCRQFKRNELSKLALRPDVSEVKGKMQAESVTQRGRGRKKVFHCSFVLSLDMEV